MQWMDTTRVGRTEMILLKHSSWTKWEKATVVSRSLMKAPPHSLSWTLNTLLFLCS